MSSVCPIFHLPPRGGEGFFKTPLQKYPPPLKVVLGRTGEDFLHTTLNIDFEFCEKKTETFFLSVCSKFWCIIYTCLSMCNTCTLHKMVLLLLMCFPCFSSYQTAVSSTQELYTKKLLKISILTKIV